MFWGRHKYLNWNRRLRLSFLLAFVAVLMTDSAVSAETLVWGKTSFPPGYITEGPQKGQGYADKLDSFMIEKLTQYGHKIVEFPSWERFLRTINQGPLVCTSILWYRPPGERAPIKGAYRISAPNGVFFLHDVVVHKDNRHLFGEEVSFRDLVANQKLTFGYNRPYGITFNRILSDHLGIAPGVEFDAISTTDRHKYLKSAKNVFARIGPDMIGGLMKMLLQQKVDYVLEYEFMVRYQQDKIGFSDDLVSIPVSEVKNKMNWITYACSDTPEGEKVISAINQVLKTYRDTDEFKDALSYLVPVGREERYWSEFEKILDVFE